MHSEEEATKFVEVFLSTPFSGDERHVRRIDMLSAYEETGDLPSRPTTPSRSEPSTADGQGLLADRAPPRIAARSSSAAGGCGRSRSSPG